MSPEHISNNSRGNESVPLNTGGNSQRQSGGGGGSRRNRSNHGGDRHNSGPRRSLAYGGGRNHRNNPRHSLDSNQLRADMVGPSNNRTNTNIGNTGGYNSNRHRSRNEQGNHHYGPNQGSGFESSRNRNHHNQSTQAPRGVRSTPTLSECLINDMDEFPSLNDAPPEAIPRTSGMDPVFASAQPTSTTEVTEFVRPVAASTFAAVSNTAMSHPHPAISGAGGGGSTNHISQQSVKQYNNNRRGGNANSYNSRASASRDTSGNTYNSRGNSSNRASTGVSTTQQFQQQQQQQQQHHNTGHFSNNTNNNHPRQPPRSRRNIINGYESRRNGGGGAATRDFTQPITTMMGNMRIAGPPAAVSQFPISPHYYSGPRTYQQSPMLTTVPAVNPQHARPARTQLVLPGESASDIQEADLYKNLTADSSLPRNERVRHQIEYYFCNNNLKSDAYMRSQMDSEGWVNSKVIKMFNRIIKFGVTDDELETILRDSSKLEITRSGDELFIRRQHDPEKWTEAGLKSQLAMVYQNHPEMESSAVEHNGYIPAHTMASMNGIQHMQPLAYHMPNYMNPYAPPPMALNYGMFQFDEYSGVMNNIHDAHPMGMSGGYEHQVSMQPVPQQSMFSEPVDSKQSYTSAPHEAPLDENLQRGHDAGLEIETETYNLLLQSVTDEKASEDPTYHSNLDKLFRYWTNTLVIRYDEEKYQLFKSFTQNTSGKARRNCIDMLFKFYSRFLQRRPLIDNELAIGKNDYQEISRKLFDEFQTLAINDYEQNESIQGIQEVFKSLKVPRSPRFKQGLIRKDILKLADQLGVFHTSSSHTEQPSDVLAAKYSATATAEGHPAHHQ